MKFFNSVNEANAKLIAADEALRPALEKAGLTSIPRAGQPVPLAEASLAEKITAFLGALTPAADLPERAELLKSNEVIAARCTQAETDLLAAQTNLTTLTAEAVQLRGDLTTATTTAAALNAQLSEICLAGGVLNLTAEGQPLAADASPETKLAAALAVPVAEKLKAYQGAVNAAFHRLGLNTATLPGAPAAARAAGEQALLEKLAATTDPVEKAKLLQANMAAIRSGFRAFSNTQTK